MTPDLNRAVSVLVVENNLIDSKVIVDMLSHAEQGTFEIQTADSMEGAFKILDSNHCDVVLLDLNIKDSKGLETLNEVHRKFPAIPVVVNTGAYQDELGLKAVACGAQDYLIKGKYKPYGLHKALYYAIERKKYEQDLQCAYERLKDAQAQLIQAEKMNVIGGIASGVAHEVKNPLATILYGIEYLNGKITEKDDKVELTLKSIKEAAERANDIVKDLLDFAGLSSLIQQPYNLNEVIEHALIFIKYHCDNQRIEITKDYDPALPEVFIDKNRIEQVLIDVILNAVFVMKEGGNITLRTLQKELTADDRSWLPDLGNRVKIGDKVVLLDIDDTGPGISPENLSRIFDPFFTTRRSEGGVGLGLSIARTIMTSHDGLIELYNIPEGGARARLVFRRKK